MADSTPSGAASTRNPTVFLVLLVVLTVPFWLLDLAAGGMPGWFPDNLPVSALMIVVPAVAAAILIGRRDGRAGLGHWLRRVADAGRIHGPGRWILVVASTPPAYLSAWAIMKLLDRPLPEMEVVWWIVPVLLAAYGVSAVAEELGWTAYATDTLLTRHGVWTTGAILGTAWALWHVPGYISGGNSPMWIFWQCAYTVVLRMLIVWTYTWTDRSLFAAITVHALSNVCWNLFPANGSGYDPMYTTITLAAVLAVAAIAMRGRPSPATMRP